MGHHPQRPDVTAAAPCDYAGVAGGAAGPRSDCAGLAQSAPGTARRDQARDKGAAASADKVAPLSCISRFSISADLHRADPDLYLVLYSHAHRRFRAKIGDGDAE